MIDRRWSVCMSSAVRKSSPRLWRHRLRSSDLFWIPLWRRRWKRLRPSRWILWGNFKNIWHSKLSMSTWSQAPFVEKKNQEWRTKPVRMKCIAPYSNFRHQISNDVVSVAPRSVQNGGDRPSVEVSLSMDEGSDVQMDGPERTCDGKYKCSYCNYANKGMARLIEHIRIHTGKTFPSSLRFVT